MAKDKLKLGVLLGGVTKRVADAIDDTENAAAAVIATSVPTNATPATETQTDTQAEEDHPKEQETLDVPTVEETVQEETDTEQAEVETSSAPGTSHDISSTDTPSEPTTNPAVSVSPSLSTIASVQEKEPNTLAAAIDPDILGYTGTTQGVNIALPEDIYDAMKVLKERYYKETRIRINYSNIISQALRNLTTSTLKDM